MKTFKMPLILILILCVSMGCNDSKNDSKSEESDIAVSKKYSGPPEAVKKTFTTMYPGESDPDWQKDAHGNWESHFKKDGEKYRADFLSDGSWVETENSIDKDNLSDEIKKVIKRDYSEYEITEVEHVQHNSKGEFYDVEFKQKGKNKDVEFRSNGEIIN